MKSSRRRLSLLPSRRQSSKFGKIFRKDSTTAPFLADSAALGLLTLPSEIRNRIYDYLFEDSISTYRAAKKVGINKYKRYITSTSSAHLINLVCKQCYQECHRLYYSETIFDLSRLPVPYYNIQLFLVSPPRSVASFATHLEGIPFPCILGSGLENFQSLRIVKVVLPQRAIFRTLETEASTTIRTMDDDGIYEVIKLQPDWEVKRTSFHNLVVKHSEITFKSSMDLICHEGKRYVQTHTYDSFKLPCEYDPYGDKIISFKDQIAILDKN